MSCEVETSSVSISVEKTDEQVKTVLERNSYTLEKCNNNFRQIWKPAKFMYQWINQSVEEIFWRSHTSTGWYKGANLVGSDQNTFKFFIFVQADFY